MDSLGRLGDMLDCVETLDWLDIVPDQIVDDVAELVVAELAGTPPLTRVVAEFASFLKFDALPLAEVVVPVSITEIVVPVPVTEVVVVVVVVVVRGRLNRAASGHCSIIVRTKLHRARRCETKRDTCGRVSFWSCLSVIQPGQDLQMASNSLNNSFTQESTEELTRSAGDESLLGATFSQSNMYSTCASIISSNRDLHIPHTYILWNYSTYILFYILWNRVDTLWNHYIVDSLWNLEKGSNFDASNSV